MAFSGINFRATGGFVADGSGETNSLGEAYPVTRGGLTFGWATNKTGDSRDRTTGVDRRLAGIVFQPNSASATTFRLDLPSGAGVYRVRLALGDENSQQNTRCLIRDGTGGSVLATINGSTLAAEWIDAAGTVHFSASGWVSANGTVNLTFTASHLVLELGGHSSGTFSSVISHLAVEPVSTGPSFTTQPSNQTVTAPNTASFSAVYTGTITGHQWQVSTNGGSSWANVSDGTGQSGGSGTGGTLTYTTTATAVSTGNHRNAYQYRCVLNPSGTPVNSSAATLTVNAPPLTITTDPLRDQNNTLLASTTLTRAYAIRISDHTLVANWASPITNPSGVLSLSNAALTAAPHLLVTYTATGLLAGAQVYTPA